MRSGEAYGPLCPQRPSSSGGLVIKRGDNNGAIIARQPDANARESGRAPFSSGASSVCADTHDTLESTLVVFFCLAGETAHFADLYDNARFFSISLSLSLPFRRPEFPCNNALVNNSTDNVATTTSQRFSTPVKPCSR